MVSKGDLGVGYLIAVGVSLFGALTSGLLWPARSETAVITPNAMLALLTGIIIAGGFTLSGIGLAKSKLDGERVWRVALWSTAGLGVPTFLIVILAGFYQDALAGLGWRSVAMINIAGGGVVGILVGTLTELRAEHEQTLALNQRNAVFLRLFRHDIRNGATSILGHVDLLAADESSTDRSIEVIRGRTDHIVRLSDAARQLDDLRLGEATESVDLVACVRHQVEVLGTSFPDARIETDFPPKATVLANGLLNSVVENLLRNAIEHNNDRPVVRVSITSSGTQTPTVDLRIEDNGPGIPRDELLVHRQATETELHHSDGIGLWLTRWIVDSFDGVLSIDNAETGGAVVTVTLPSEQVSLDLQ